MTALKPLENLRVRAVPSERYPLNKTCASPMSDAGTPADDPHHCFPRSQIGGDSWFVEITEDGGQITLPVPHVVGLSREQHERVERHDAWIKLEDGTWNWYERIDDVVPSAVSGREALEEWELVGPLNPQPGSVEQKPKRKRFKGEQKKQRRTISIRIPEGSDYEAYEEKMEQGAEIYQRELKLGDKPYPFLVIDAALQNFIETYGLFTNPDSDTYGE